MTSPVVPSQGGATALGRSAARRWSRPGPPGRRRPAPLGSVAAAAARFSAGLARPPEVRRQLAGPGEIRPGRLPENLRPPRWWRPPAEAETSVTAQGSHPSRPAAAALRRTVLTGWSTAAQVEPTLPSRGLRRAAAAMPTDGSRAPGGVTLNMAGSTVPVRRIPEVKAAGAMQGADRKLVARRPAPSRPPGSGSVPSSGTGAAGPPGVVTGDGEIRRSVAVPRAGLGNTAPAAPGRPGALNRARANGSAPRQRDRASFPDSAVGRGWVARRRAVQATIAEERGAPPAVHHAARPTDPRSAESLSSALRRSWARPASVASSAVSSTRTEVRRTPASGSLGAGRTPGGRGQSDSMAESRSAGNRFGTRRVARR